MTTIYRKYRIEPKRDFGSVGYFIKGKYVKKGFVVVSTFGDYPGCNAMPGATWFQTVTEAKRGIDALISVGVEPGHSDAGITRKQCDAFWQIVQGPSPSQARKLIVLKSALAKAKSKLKAIRNHAKSLNREWDRRGQDVLDLETKIALLS